jgi:hypothetical protein
MLFHRRRPKRRIGLDERLRRHHAANRARRAALVVVLGAAVIVLSLFLGRSSSRYDAVPVVIQSR